MNDKDLYNQTIRLELSPVAHNSRVFVGDTDISHNVTDLAIQANARQGYIEITLQCIVKQPFTVEGVLIPKEDAEAYHAWQFERMQQLERIKARHNG